MSGLIVHRLNNGVLGVFGSTSTDLSVTRSPSLRDSVKPDGSTNGAFMHDASLQTLEEVVDFYSTGIQDHDNLSSLLKTGNQPTKFNFTVTQKEDLVNYLKTLTDAKLVADVKYSDPFK